MAIAVVNSDDPTNFIIARQEPLNFVPGFTFPVARHGSIDRVIEDDIQPGAREIERGIGE